MDWFDDQIEAARHSGASSLDLSGRLAGTLPESLGNLTALTELFVGGNQLTVLPQWLGNLTALTRLGVSAEPFELPKNRPD
jgi:Leucine-rich repeat (LRR) protein